MAMIIQVFLLETWIFWEAVILDLVTLQDSYRAIVMQYW